MKNTAVSIAAAAAAAAAAVLAPGLAISPAQAGPYGCTPWGKVSRGEYRHEITQYRSQPSVEADITAGGCYVADDPIGTTEAGYDYRKLYYQPGTGSWGDQFREIRVKYIYAGSNAGGWVVQSKRAVRW